MFIRTTVQFLPACGQVRTMATLKEISMRVKAVTNIQKITKSMKMISAAKYARAERELKPARSYGVGAKALYEKVEVEVDEKKPNQLLVAMSSDRGLCGAIHSNIYRAIRASIANKPANSNVKIVAVGDKAKALLYKDYPEEILMSCNSIGKLPPTFGDAGIIANEIMSSGYEFDSCVLYYNVYKSIVSYQTTLLPVFTREALRDSEKMSVYDSIDAGVLESYSEFALASLLFFTMKESACSEQSSRMTAMEAASKNASEMIGKLTLTYNRTRQAVITRELIEIISGAAAL